MERMEKTMQPLSGKKPDLGLGMAIGLPAGALLGMIFLNGNIAMGLSIGLLAATAYGAVPATSRVNRLYPFIGIAAGALAGAILGLLLGLLHGQYAAATQQAHATWLFGLPYKGGYSLVCASFLAAVGLPLSVTLAARKQSQAH